MDISPEPFTLQSWLERWLAIYAPLRCQSLKTIERYRGLARNLDRTAELRALAETPLDRLTHENLERGILSLLTIKARHGGTLSFRSVRHFAALLRVALEKAVALGKLRGNPLDQVELPPLTFRQTATLSEDEVRAIRAAPWPGWLSVLIELALATGCRRGELLALEWNDVNFRTRTLTVGKSLEQTKSGLRLKSTKSNRPRLLILPARAVERLKQHQRDNPGGALVFAGENGRHRKPDRVSQAVCRGMRDFGIPKGNLHMLRHTHATYLLSLGVPVKAISARLGHADPNITLRLYVHALPADDQRAADVWDRFIAGE